MFLLDGKQLVAGRPFSHNGINYPANWLTLSTLEERTAIGILEVDRSGPPSYDPRFYYGINDDGTLIPRPLDELKISFTQQTKEFANSFLTPSDWMVVRKADNGTPVPSGFTEWRQDVRSACEAKCLTIELEQSVPDLENYITYYTEPSGAATDYSVWPQEPAFNPGDV